MNMHDTERNYTYVAVKLTGCAHWLWFERERVERENGRFVGKLGWGRGGAETSIDVSDDTIEGTIVSNTLQYGS